MRTDIPPGIPRWADAVLAAGLLLAFMPLLLLLAVGVRVSSPGPVLFRQTRVGRGGRLFTMLKFRSMRADGPGLQITATDDERITSFGRILRRTKLDELPELWNVIRGEMSLVGPRPEVPCYVDMQDPAWIDVLQATPGLTDPVTATFRSEERLLASVEGDRDAFYRTVLLPYKLEGYRAYLRRRSVRSDLQTLSSTLLAVCLPLTVKRTAVDPADPRPADAQPGLLLRHRRVLVVLIHLSMAATANYLAFLLRFDGSIPASQVNLWVDWILVLVVIRGLTFVPFGLYQGLWRYVSVWDVRNIVVAAVSSTLLFVAVVRGAWGVAEYPRSVYILDTILLIGLLTGVRLGRRIARELGQDAGEKSVLVFGAGDAGEMIVRDMRNNPFYRYRPVGFVDDDPAKKGTSIHGVPVLGGRKDLQGILAYAHPDEVLIAIPRALPKAMREIVHALEPYKIPIRTLPNLGDLISGKVKFGEIRDLSVEDLLARRPVSLSGTHASELISGKRVLVTGAGGSIGSELCRQILALAPSELLLLERYENGLYEIAKELGRQGTQVPVAPIIADICDADRVYEVFARYRPEVVFHAAAHKHVPMMELNPCEAVKNNVLGTRCVAHAADRFGAERFVLISTDKAVNPTSVMGVTKRVAEFLVQELAARSRTAFVTVRFGNVLGSSGSVVPLFLEQIKAGGPVTVTHPEMRRFFMLIPEAVALVLHAAALARGGEVFVLDMGEQIKLADMARNLIRLAGYVPDRDIEVRYTGIRPGEKLHEELVGLDETVEYLESERMLRVRPMSIPVDLDRRVSELGHAAASGSTNSLIEQLKAIVPRFQAQPAGPPSQPALLSQSPSAASPDPGLISSPVRTASVPVTSLSVETLR